jgi:hypothetical protein
VSALVVTFILAATVPVNVRRMVLGIKLLARRRTHRHELKDSVRRRLEIRGIVHDLHESSHLILGEKFDTIFFSVGIKDVRKTSSREGRYAFGAIGTLEVPAEDVMEFLFDVDDGEMMSAEVLHDYSYQRRVKREERRVTGLPDHPW